ncbi:MAG: hypothetical protein C4534_10250 [Gaiellales bacterium]|nr:MAG: hypothetical protein C4534_10250 [Gaiellales bacterium]
MTDKHSAQTRWRRGEIFVFSFRLLSILVVAMAGGVILEPQLPGALVGGWAMFVSVLNFCFLARYVKWDSVHNSYALLPLLIPALLSKTVKAVVREFAQLLVISLRKLRPWVRAVIDWILAALTGLQNPHRACFALALEQNTCVFALIPHALPLRSPPTLISR